MFDEIKRANRQNTSSSNNQLKTIDETPFKKTSTDSGNKASGGGTFNGFTSNEGNSSTHISQIGQEDYIGIAGLIADAAKNDNGKLTVKLCGLEVEYTTFSGPMIIFDASNNGNIENVNVNSPGTYPGRHFHGTQKERRETE